MATIHLTMVQTIEINEEVFEREHGVKATRANMINAALGVKALSTDQYGVWSGSPMVVETVFEEAPVKAKPVEVKIKKGRGSY